MAQWRIAGETLVRSSTHTNVLKAYCRDTHTRARLPCTLHCVGGHFTHSYWDTHSSRVRQSGGQIRRPGKRTTHENTDRSLIVVPREIVVSDHNEFRLILREREAKIKEQAMERDRRLAEAEALLRETELREAARKEREDALRETERQLSEAAAWNALILPKETKEALQIHCEMLRNHRYYLSQGIDVPKGLLFHGPPGCGKTETARLLSKISGFEFVSLSSADLKVGFIGQAAVAIQRHFNEARQKAPCIVYIDEIDASCPTRTSGQNSVIDNEVNAQLLQEFDGFKTTSDQPVFVFASTNRVDLIDPAILERFTQHIEIALPTAIERFQLIDRFIGKVPFDFSPPDDIEEHSKLGLLGRLLRIWIQFIRVWKARSSGCRLSR